MSEPVQISDFILELFVGNWEQSDMTNFITGVCLIAEEMGIWKRVHHSWLVAMRARGVQPLPLESGKSESDGLQQNSNRIEVERDQKKEEAKKSGRDSSHEIKEENSKDTDTEDDDSKEEEKGYI